MIQRTGRPVAGSGAVTTKSLPSMLSVTRKRLRMNRSRGFAARSRSFSSVTSIFTPVAIRKSAKM